MRLCQSGSVACVGGKITYVINKDLGVEYYAEVLYNSEMQNNTFISDASAKRWVVERIDVIFKTQGYVKVS